MCRTGYILILRDARWRVDFFEKEEARFANARDDSHVAFRSPVDAAYERSRRRSDHRMLRTISHETARLGSDLSSAARRSSSAMNSSSVTTVSATSCVSFSVIRPILTRRWTGVDACLSAQNAQRNEINPAQRFSCKWQYRFTGKSPPSQCCCLPQDQNTSTPSM